MIMRPQFSVLAVVLPLVSCYASAVVIDLSHDQGPKTLYWGGGTFNRTVNVKGYLIQNKWIETGKFRSKEHGGTHIDSPSHFAKDHFDVSQIPIDNTIAEGVVIDVEKETGDNNNYQLPLQKVLDWETKNGKIPNRAAVLVRFGWSKYWDNATKFFGTDDIYNGTTYTLPTVSPDAADWLLKERDILMLGVDSASPDPAYVGNFPVHRNLLGHNRIVIENLKIPETLPLRHFRLHAVPIKVVEGTGVPTRVYAMLYDNANSGSGRSLGDTQEAGLMWMLMGVVALVRWMTGREKALGLY